MGVGGREGEEETDSAGRAPRADVQMGRDLQLGRSDSFHPRAGAVQEDFLEEKSLGEWILSGENTRGGFQSGHRPISKAWRWKYETCAQ